jgi:hypothetical protein
MSERIKLLAEQSGVKLNSGMYEGPFIGAVREDWLEKFAELIVKECMSMSDELKAQYFTSRKSTMDFDEKNIYAEGEAACDTLRYKMKKHFGVEE